MVFFFNADTDSEGKMYESLFPADDIWEKFDIPPADYDYSDVLLDNDPDPVMNELPPFVPTSYVMGRHDCMWAGMCGNGYHVNHDITKPKSAPVVAVTVTVKSSRSVLRTNRQTKICSPRPDTPSESEEDESPLYKSVCDNEDFSLMVSVSEVTGQISRTSAEYKSISSPTSPDPSQTVFHTDHSYHLSKTAVALDNLGVQTPSDSEEEIDVVSVVDREKLTTLPTNPSAQDKQELQQTVATAIEHREARRKKRQSDEEDNERPMKRRRGRPTEYDSEDTSDKRNQHNNMERLRRIDLRDSITRLRGMVPSVSKNERAPKVQILKEAAIYCHKLTAKQENLLLQKEKLVAMQRALTAQVRQLRLKNAKERGFEKQELQWIQHNEQESSSRGDKHKRQHKERKRKKVLKLVKIAGEQ